MFHISIKIKDDSKQSKITAPRAVFKEVEKSKSPEGNTLTHKKKTLRSF